MTKPILKFAAIALAVISLVSCEKYDYVDYKALQDAELTLLKEYYQTQLFTDLIAQGDTTDLRGANQSGMLMVLKEEGTGDKVTAGKVVGIRFSQTFIVKRDGAVVYDSNPSTTDTIEGPADNFDNLDPELFQVGSYSSKGVDYAVQKMRVGGKALLVLPTTYWSTSSYYGYSTYIPKVYEFEITYLQK